MDVAQLSRKRNEIVCSSFHGNSTGFTAEINLPKENLIFSVFRTIRDFRQPLTEKKRNYKNKYFVHGSKRR